MKIQHILVTTLLEHVRISFYYISRTRYYAAPGSDIRLQHLRICFQSVRKTANENSVVCNQNISFDTVLKHLISYDIKPCRVGVGFLLTGVDNTAGYKAFGSTDNAQYGVTHRQVYWTDVFACTMILLTPYSRLVVHFRVSGRTYLRLKSTIHKFPHTKM